MTIFLTLFFFFLIISFLVFIHELGHFTAAKLTGVGVQSFAIGFGPKLIAHKYKGTEYRINILPLGGYVQLEGEENGTIQGGFRDSKFIVKFVILTGGVFMNIIGAIVLLGIQLNISNHIITVPNYSDFAFKNTTEQEIYLPIFISETEESFIWDKPFDYAIVAINNNPIKDINDFELLVDTNRGKEVTLKYINADSGKIFFEETQYKLGGLYEGKYPLFQITEVIKDSNFDQFVEKGEILVGVNGKYFTSRTTFDELLKSSINLNSDNVFTFLDKSTGKEYSKTIKVNEVDKGQPLLGIKYDLDSGYAVSISNNLSNFYFVQYKDDLVSPFAFTYDMSAYQIKSLGTIFSDAFSSGDFTQVSENFGGPIKVGNVVNEAVEYDAIKQLFGIAGLISLSLAIFNILPIPALDGGQILIAAIESIRKKKLSDSVINKINASGFFLLIGLSIAIFVKDILELDLISNFFEIIRNALGK